MPQMAACRSCFGSCGFVQEFLQQLHGDLWGCISCNILIRFTCDLATLQFRCSPLLILGWKFTPVILHDSPWSLSLRWVDDETLLDRDFALGPRCRMAIIQEKSGNEQLLGQVGVGSTYCWLADWLLHMIQLTMLGSWSPVSLSCFLS